ncbi:MAG: aldolase/citrate lyase family protein, partial [Barnesiella sp.]
MLKLMYITNRPEIAGIAEEAGVDRIFVDLETIGKQERQGGMDTVQSTHTLDDVSTIKKAIRSAKLLVRCNPIHPGSGQEIETIIQNGADIIMLPYFKSVNEAAAFLNYVNGRVKTCLLVETPEAVDRIEGIL